MRKPLTAIELYKKLKPFKTQFAKFDETGEGHVTAEQVAAMQEVYDDVKIMSSGGLANTFNVSCASCVRDTFSVFSSLFKRYDSDPTINPDAKAIAVGGYTPPVHQDTTDYSDQLAPKETPVSVEPVTFPKQEPEPTPAPAPSQSNDIVITKTEEVPAPKEVTDLTPAQGLPLNTAATQTPEQVQAQANYVGEATLTPAQKAAATKAANKAAAEAK